MAIGATPLLPLYRVQPDPNARFQRFGLNDSQLHGKPMVETVTASPSSEPKRAVARTTSAKVKVQETPEVKQGVGAEKAKTALSTTPELAPNYSGRTGTAAGTTPEPGSKLNVKA